jgi:hypothetical protein
VVTVDGAAHALRDDVGWLPDSHRIALCHADTEHGRGVLYDDGHLVEQVIVGVSRHARGERLSANERVSGQALAHLLGLIRDFVPTERPAAVDNLDAHRRFELAHPELGRRLDDALEGPLTELASLLVDIAERYVAPRLAIETARPLAALRMVLDRTAPSTPLGPPDAR